MNKIAVVKDLILKRGGCTLQPSLSFIWEYGQHWCVTGATGSGKTTLLKTLAGHLHAAGAVIDFPYLEALRAASAEKRYLSDMIAYVSQEVQIPAGYVEDLYYQRRFQAAEQDDIPTTRDILLKAAKNDETDLQDAARLMHLTDLLDQPFVQLSNGQSRRLMIALALVRRPRLLILDNPYTGLDQQTRLELNEVLRSLTGEGIHIFMAAHEHELRTIGFITNVLHFESRDSIESEETFPVLLQENVQTLAPDATVIELVDTHVTYGDKVVLKSLNWKVNARDRWVVKGPNGSGKSTLLTLIFADHPQAYANTMYLFGHKRGTGESIWDIKKRIGYFSPELLRYYELQVTALEAIASGENDIVGQVGFISEARRERVAALASWLGITSLLPVRLHELSAGQQKIVLLARAMIKNPPLLILDEPLQGLDLNWRAHLRKKIDQFARNKALLYVTHDEEEIPEGEWQVLELKVSR